VGQNTPQKWINGGEGRWGVIPPSPLYGRGGELIIID